MSSPLQVSTTSAEMPIPGGALQKDMIRALGSPMSIYEFCVHLPFLSDARKNDPVLRANRFSVNETTRTIDADGSTGLRMVFLLHSIDRTALQAIVSGTVAYTASMKQSKWLQMPTEPEGKVPGIYVIGPKHSLKGGKFLNIIETERLIDGLRRYAKGARLCRTNQSQDTFDSADKEIVKWVSTVDWQGGYNLRPDSMHSPQSIQSDGEFSKIEGLIS
ncbi:hypothetical protein FOQG_09077 [Fusarium oxysporum f. sp. raphani 54005]|uniref:Uncharacterized protein n=3 Tax=Fusarium oxysporum TaxID=5507 RepID=X0C7R8_FUSOX|nr:hypothetical protein FOVG_17562 [Fusarium oxysporum f. sp. pisi HDV247]EXK87233.1 hypothetical protein FOQG_09077 [Fusarium oxysporum f. sp. raphani 54005]KAG7434600.1 hypothetical protein Forpi1262_v005330 [Fusarium oxysporum f. sp. raphani]